VDRLRNKKIKARKMTGGGLGAYEEPGDTKRKRTLHLQKVPSWYFKKEFSEYSGRKKRKKMPCTVCDGKGEKKRGL